MAQEANGPRAVLVYDGGCAFCRKWAARIEARCAPAVAIRTFEDAQREDPRWAGADLDAGVRLLLADGQVHVGAAAILRALELGGRWRVAAWLYRRVRLFRVASDRVYRFVARRRKRDCGTSCGAAAPRRP